jgi:hypothetical protein
VIDQDLLSTLAKPYEQSECGLCLRWGRRGHLGHRCSHRGRYQTDRQPGEALQNSAMWLGHTSVTVTLRVYGT